MEQYALFDVVTVLWANLLQVLLRHLLLRLQLEVPPRTDREQALPLVVLKELVGHHSALAYQLWWLVVLICSAWLGQLAVQELLSKLNKLLVAAGLHRWISSGGLKVIACAVCLAHQRWLQSDDLLA